MTISKILVAKRSDQRSPALAATPKCLMRAAHAGD
jgi:hypothetical protein